MASQPQPSPHHILTPLQQTLLELIFRTDTGRERFALAGGTALAEYYCGHRLSKDLDIFSETPADIPLLSDEIAPLILADIAGAKTDWQRRTPTFRHFVVSRDGDDPVQIDIAAADPPLLDPIARINGINVLGLTDIAVGTMMAIHDRIEIRDAIDLWMLERGGVDLEFIRELALKKDLGLADAPLLLIASLDRLRDRIRKLPWPHMLVSLDADVLESFLTQLAARFLVAIRNSEPGNR